MLKLGDLVTYVVVLTGILYCHNSIVAFWTFLFRIC